MIRKLSAVIFSAVLVLCLFGMTGANAESAAVPSEYTPILENYYTLIADGQYAALTADDLMNMGACPLLAGLTSEEKGSFGYYLEDINGDGMPELFMGVDNNEFNDTIYQLYTVFAGQVGCLYTSSEGNGLYLLEGGLLEYEAWDLNGDNYAMCLYQYGGDGYMTVTDGVLYNVSTGTGPYFSITDDSFDPSKGTAITEAVFNRKVDSFMMKEKFVRYAPLSEWYKTAHAQPEQSGETSIGGNKPGPRHQKRNSSTAQETESSSDGMPSDAGASGQQTGTGPDRISADAGALEPQADTGSDRTQADAGASAGPQTGPDASAVQGNNTGYYYRHETLIDSKYGVRVADVLVPEGWSASLNVNWEHIDTTTPGVATVELKSPDGRARIVLASAQQFYDLYRNNVRNNEGPDISLFYTALYYRDAEGVMDLTLKLSGFENAQLVETYPVGADWIQMMKEAGQYNLQQQVASTGGTPVECDGSAAHSLYRSGSQYIELFTLVYMSRVYANTGHVVMDQTSWNIPYNGMFIADSKETCDKYQQVFRNVLTYSSFSNEFMYVNYQYGNLIDQLISSNLLSQSELFLQSSAGTWASDYEKTSGYDSDRFMDQWSDVIKEQNEYTTLDGETYKISTSYDTVYQNGDQLYMGPEGQSPYGWTRLYPN